MTSEVVTQLKKGSVKAVVPFGSKIPAPPYVVVKPEAGIDARRYRVICHMNQGELTKLENYIFNESSTLLANAALVDAYGNHFTVKDAEEYTDVLMVNDDSTISMERVFYVPSRLH